MGELGPTPDDQQKWSWRDRLLWWHGSFWAARHADGPFWFWGRRRREERFVLQLLSTYPGLADQRRSDLLPVVTRVRAALRGWRVFIVSGSVGIGAAVLVFVGFLGLRAVGVSFSSLFKYAVLSIVVAVASDVVRRIYIRQEMTRATAAVFPSLFCPCGYCLIGLAPDGRCPECGAAQPGRRNDCDSSSRGG